MRVSYGLCVFFSTALSGCVVLAVGSESSPSADFTAYRTFGWETAESLPSGDARLDDDAFFDARVRGAAEDALTTKALEPVPEGARLMLHYHFSMDRRIDVYRLDDERGYSSLERRASEWVEGTLVVGIADANSKRIVWRGWAKLDVTGVLDDRERLDGRISEAVRRIFERYPPT